MTDSPMKPAGLPLIDARLPEADHLISALRLRLSPRGDVVTEAQRTRTSQVFGAALTPEEAVERICSDVRAKGIEALLRYGEAFDRATLTAETLRVDPQRIATAHAQATPAFLETIRYVRNNVAEFQTALLGRDTVVSRSFGLGTVQLRQRIRPLNRVGVCVPGGSAAYPSTLLMTVVPAQVAGVRQIAVMAPPTEYGAWNTAVLATCHELGIDELYQVGGAHGVAMLAYGVPGIPRVDKIVGPGNLFVALAKRFVYGTVDIDSIAGPSEVVVVADHSAQPAFVASDLIAQAEHSPGSAVLITWHEPLVHAVQVEVERQLPTLSRSSLAARSLAENGAIILVRNRSDAIRLANDFAPEHLQLSTADAWQVADEIHNAGAIFVGHFTPVPVGDYVAGPAHVLPTGGTARFANGLSAVDFQKRTSVIAYDEASLAAEAEHIRRLATLEGLTAHRHCVDVRLTATP